MIITVIILSKTCTVHCQQLCCRGSAVNAGQLNRTVMAVAQGSMCGLATSMSPRRAVQPGHLLQGLELLSQPPVQ